MTIAAIRCACCSAPGEAIEVIGMVSGVLVWAFLPFGWRTLLFDGSPTLLCGPCFEARPDRFDDRRAGSLAASAAAVGIPIDIAAQWCAEWQQRERSAA